MYKVARSALVMHSAEDMYSLVFDINAYSLFLPWCSDSQVLAQSEREMTARVAINYRGVRKSFTTRNHLKPGISITMTLVDGPFNKLSGVWDFKALRTDACRISLDMSFDFSVAVVGQIVGPVFQHIADSMVDSFVRRAQEIYPAAQHAQSQHMQADTIRVEVVYALPERQLSEHVQFNQPDASGIPNAPVTIEQAIRASSLLEQFPDINLANTPVGVFGTERPLDWQLEDNDRVEIYRPLTMHPTEARRLRAKRKA